MIPKDIYLIRKKRAEELYEKGDYLNAIEQFKSLLEKTKNDDDSGGYFDILFNLGKCFKALGNPQEARKYYHQGLNEVLRLNTNENIKTIQNTLQFGLMQTYIDTGNYENAQEICLSVLKSAKEIGDLSTACAANSQLALIASRLNHLTEAIERYKFSENCFTKLNDKPNLIVCKHQLGRMYEQLKDWNGAEQCYREVAELTESVGDKKGLVKISGNLALVFELSGKFQDAIEWYRQAIKIGKEIGDMVEVAEKISNLANT